MPRVDQRDPKTTTSNPGEERRGGIFHVSYDIEGSDVGYRWFERENLTPLFPFGYGQSYTDFAFSDVESRAVGTRIEVSLKVVNTGDRAGVTVLQIYCSKTGKNGFVSRLGGFSRVELEPGERKSVTVTVDPRLLARFDPSDRAFHISGGDYRVFVGDHAQDWNGVRQNVTLGKHRL